MRLGIFLLVLWILPTVNSLKAKEILGRIVAMDPKTKEVVVRPLSREVQEIVLRDPQIFGSYRLGDLVRVDIEISGHRLEVKNIKPFTFKDRTGVRKRLKMRRRYHGHRKR